MANVQRICDNCGESGPLEARYCPHCGYDREATLPAPTRNLPMVIGKAALPVLAGAASLALRVGWKILQQRLNAPPTVTAAPTEVARPPQSVPTSTRPRRTVRIRSTWAVGDATGRWQQGSSEHIIEFDD